MGLKNKRGAGFIGEAGVFSKVVLGIFVFFIGMVVVFSAMNWDKNNAGDSIGNAFNEASDFFLSVFGPLFSGLLGAEGENLVLMILTFILVSIVVVGTLDSIDIFGTGSQSRWMNFGVGMITAIIGVRFMPPNMWASLTAPSSAFVATILVAIPFVAMFFVSMKMENGLARKLIWIFYLIFMSYLIFFPEEGAGLSNRFMWIYLLFLFLAGIMMFFDSTVRGFIKIEKTKTDLAKGMKPTQLIKKAELMEQLKNVLKLRSTYKRKDPEWQGMGAEIEELKGKIQDISKPI